MKLLASLALLVATTGACQRGSGDTVDPAYRADFENICDAEARSGALKEDPDARANLVATWLQPRVKTDEARRFLAGLQKLQPKEKGDALRRESARAGLQACALAETWK